MDGMITQSTLASEMGVRRPAKGGDGSEPQQGWSPNPAGASTLLEPQPFWAASVMRFAMDLKMMPWKGSTANQ